VIGSSDRAFIDDPIDRQIIDREIANSPSVASIT
jgi:hypothetical protein